MVLDPIPQPLPVHFFGSRPQPPTSPRHVFASCSVRETPKRQRRVLERWGAGVETQKRGGGLGSRPKRCLSDRTRHVFASLVHDETDKKFCCCAQPSGRGSAAAGLAADARQYARAQKLWALCRGNAPSSSIFRCLLSSYFFLFFLSLCPILLLSALLCLSFSLSLSLSLSFSLSVFLSLSHATLCSRSSTGHTDSHTHPQYFLISSLDELLWMSAR